MKKNEVKSPKTNAFSFKLTAKAGKKVHNTSQKSFINENKINNDEKEFIVAAEGKQLKSSVTKKKPAQLVIPLIQKNNWRVVSDDADQEAAEEIIKSLRDEAENESVSTLSIPILMRNKLPAKKDVDVGDEMHDISLRPEQSSMDDYENIPISAFGTAMLRGMGWSEGKPIGLNSKGLVEPIEYIPRHKGLGLGAEKRMQPPSKRKRKLGDVKPDENRYMPIVEKDGRVRHVKGVGEEVKKRPEGFFPGAFVQITGGVHRDLYGKIISVDEDNARLSVKLYLSGEVVEISQYNSYLVDEDAYKAAHKQERKSDSSKSGRVEKKQKEHIEYDTRSDDEKSEPSWIVPGIRVRIISKKYKQGKCYNKKVRILDVISQSLCTCQTEEKKLLEDVRQKDLETVIPKSKGAYVMVIGGKYQGQLGKLMERDKSKCKATIQLTSNKHITKISYDYMSEYVGELPDDEFL